MPRVKIERRHKVYPSTGDRIAFEYLPEMVSIPKNFKQSGYPLPYKVLHQVPVCTATRINSMGRFVRLQAIAALIFTIPTGFAEIDLKIKKRRNELPLSLVPGIEFLKSL